MNSFRAAGSVGTLLDDSSLELPSSVSCEVNTSSAYQERRLVALI